MIRHAVNSDIPRILDLLVQVCQVHHDVRPDLFKGQSATKYTPQELEAIIANEKTPVFVCVDEAPQGDAAGVPDECDGSAGKLGEVKGYAFCVFKQYENDNILTDIKTLYIDDLCVDEKFRGQHIGKELYEYVLDFAREQGCYNVTLNVWAGNDPAIAFYEKRGLKPQKIGMEVILQGAGIRL